MLIFVSEFDTVKMNTNTKIRFTSTDKLLEVLGILATIALLIIPLVFYSDLPNEIPTHYGIKGLPDAWGSKASIWVLPVIGFLMYLGLALLNYFVIANTALYSSKGNKQSVPPANILRMMQLLKLMLSLAFVYIVWQTIAISLDQATGLGMWFLPVFMVSMTALPLGVILKFSGKLKK